MYYAVGTRIDLSHMNKPKEGAIAAQFNDKIDKPKRRLYSPGTKILIVRMLPTFETITLVPAV